MVRYSVLRLLLFFGFLLAFYLVGLRALWLVLAAALGSMVVSFYLLRGPREEFSRRIAERVDRRAQRITNAQADASVEDVEAANDGSEASRPREP